jgi:hypothetical protein
MYENRNRPIKLWKKKGRGRERVIEGVNIIKVYADMEIPQWNPFVQKYMLIHFVFALGIFQTGFNDFSQGQSQTPILLSIASCSIAGMTGVPHYTQLINWDGTSLTFLSRLPSNCDPPDLHLLSNWDYRHESLHLAKSLLKEKNKVVCLFHLFTIHSNSREARDYRG